MRTEKLENIINKNDKDLMEMVTYIKRNNRQGFNVGKKFKTYTLETSRGKTTGSAYAMCMSIGDGNKTKYIFTTKTKKECERVAETIKEELNETFAEFDNEPIVMIYTPEAKEDTEISSSDFFKCAKAKVLIITHATYLNICNPKKNEKYKKYQEWILQHYHTLIVDEEINPVVNTLCLFNNNIYETTLQLLKATNNKEIIESYDILCSSLKDTIKFYLNEKKCKDKIIVAEKVSDSILINQITYESLIERINSIDEQVIKDYKHDNNINVSRSDIVEAVEKLFRIYNNLDFDQVLYWNGTLYSCDFDFKFLMLQKNIWLDASANFSKIYELGNLFDVVKSKRIIDHSNCNLYWHNYNTSKSAKRKTSDKNQLTEWRKFIVEEVKRKSKKDSDVLIITHKAECSALEKDFIDEDFIKLFPNYAFLNFFNMRGVDDYAEYTEGFMIHSPRFPFPVYVLMYMYYAMEDEMDIFKLDMAYGKYRENNSIGFRNEVLDKLMFTDEVSNLYQGCKRICRSKNPQGNFHVFNSNFDIVKAIKNELFNIVPIPDEDNKRARLCEEFLFLLEKIREGQYDKYKVLGKKDTKVKAVKRGKKNYYEVNKKLFYEVLSIASKNFKRDIIDKVKEDELKIKFEKDIVRVYF